MQENTSPTQSSGRKTSIRARSPQPTISFLSLHVDVWCGWLRRACPHQEARHQTGRAQVGDTLHARRVPPSGGGDGSSTSSAAVLFLFYSRHLHSARVIISADRGSSCAYPTAPFARPGVGTRALYRGGNPVRGTGRKNGGGVGSRNGVGGGNGDINGDGNRDGARTRTGVGANAPTQDGNGDGSGDNAGTKTGRGVETRGRTQDRNGDESKDGLRQDGGEAMMKRKKPHKSSRRDGEKGGELSGKKKYLDKKWFVQCPLCRA